MKENKDCLKEGEEMIRALYEKIDKVSTNALHELMPVLGDHFPTNEGDCPNAVNRNLGNKFFGDLTQIEKIYKDNGKYRVKVKAMTIDWEKLHFFDKHKVLLWIYDMLAARKQENPEIDRMKDILEFALRKINENYTKVSNISDMLLKEVLPQPADCCNINYNIKDEEAICLCLDDFEQPEPIVKVCKSEEEGKYQVHTTFRILEWDDLPPLEKSFLISRVK